MLLNEMDSIAGISGRRLLTLQSEVLKVLLSGQITCFSDEQSGRSWMISARHIASLCLARIRESLG